MKVKTRFFPFLVLLAGISFPGGTIAANLFSTGNDGRWNSTGTWTNGLGGAIPTASDDVTIFVNHVVTVNVTTATAGSLRVRGSAILRFSTTTTSALSVVSGNLDVYEDGDLLMGTPSAPIPASIKATLSLGSGDSLHVYDSGTFTAQGAAKNPVAHAVNSLAVGATSLQVPDAQAAGWVVGDTITISHADVLAAAPSSFVKRTESRSIASLSSAAGLTTVGWSNALSYAHQAAADIRVANLSRNVVIQPNGSPVQAPSVGTESAFFSASYVQFSRLSLSIYNGGFASVSSSTFRDSVGVGIYFDSTAGSLIRSNVFYGSADTAFYVLGSGAFIEDNELVSVKSVGMHIHSTASNHILRRNHVYNSDWTGMEVWGNNHVLDGNVTSYNQGGGMDVNESSNTIINHVSEANMQTGLYLSGAGNVASGIGASYNGRDGMTMQGDGIWLSSANAHGNGASGIVNNLARGNVYAGLKTYLNQDVGFWLSEGEYTAYDVVLGYDLSGASAVDGGDELASWNNGHDQHATLKGLRANPITGVWFQGYDSSFMSFNQDFSTGVVHVLGARTLGGDLILDHGQPTWPAAATDPRLMRGSGHVAMVTSVSDANAENQLVTVRCLNGAANQWTVEGATGTLYGPFTGGLTGQNVADQFILDFTPGFTPETEDRVSFLLTSSSRDANRQKKVYFDDGGSAGVVPNSSLVVPPGVSFALRGVSGTPAVMETAGPATPVYYFVSSGSLTMENATVRRMHGSGGFQVSGGDGVAMSSVTFDDVGSAGAYVLAKDLTSNATFYNMTFDAGAADPLAPFGVQVAGNDGGLRWYMASFAGRRSGDTRDDDPRQKVLWADSLAPQNIPGLTAASGSNTGEITLSWTSPADRENLDPNATTSTLRGGSFLLFRSTVQATRDGAVMGQAQTVISTTAAGGELQSRVEGTLTLGTAYYYRMWAADEFGNASASVDAGTVPARVKPFAPPNFGAVQSGAGILLSWAHPVNPPAPYRASYQLEYSTISGAGPWSAPISISASTTSYMHPSLQPETTYYYQLYAVDTGGGVDGTSLPAAAQAKTQDVTAPLVSPSVGARTMGVAWNQAPVLTFTKAMNPSTVPGAVSLKRLVDHLGVPVPVLSQDVSVTLSSNSAGTVFTVNLPAPLERNNVYELTVAATAADVGGKLLGAPAVLRFATMMDHTVDNRVTEGAMGAYIDVPAQALPEDGYMTAGPAPASAVAAATQKLVSNTGDPYRSLVQGAVMDLSSFDSGDVAQNAFSSLVTVSLPYPDADGDGVLDGTSPPVFAKTLTVHWLDEVNNLWVPLASALDASARRVSARTPHFTSFALFSQADLDLTGAFAFPTPFRPAAGHTTITFSGVGQAATVKVMTPDGEPVWEGSSSGGLSQIVWDVRNSDGVPVTTGVYLYRITNASSSKTGKLAVIR